jgi:PKD repeat protein
MHGAFCLILSKCCTNIICLRSSFYAWLQLKQNFMKKLYKHKIIILSALSVLFMAAGTALKNGSGAPASYTNAPSESNCTTSGCHSSYSLNPTSSNLNNLTLTGTFTGGGYIPDSTYTLTLSYAQSGINRFGMQLTCLTRNSAAPAGTLTAGSGSSKITGTVIGQTRQYLNHTSASSSGSRSWTFTWKAPANNVDTVIFYVVVNAANNDGNSTGDEIYAKTFKFGPSSLLPKASITASASVICAGEQIQYTGAGTNSPTSYKWALRGTPSTSASQNVNVTYNTPGTFVDSLWVYNSKGESAPATFKVTVNAKPPALIISKVPGTTICQGDTAVLTANFGQNYHYSWNTGNPADTLRTLSVTKGGSYEVTTSVAGGCKTTSSAVVITVNPKPTLTLTSDALNDETCISDSVTFTATTTANSITFYKNNTAEQTGAGTTYKTKLAATDTVRAEVTDNGCTSTLEEKPILVVSPAAGPTLSCGTATTSSVTFEWLPIGTATAYEVSIDSGKTWATPSSGTVGLNHTIGGLGFSVDKTIWVRAIDNSLCGKTLVSSKTCTTLSCSGVTYKTVLGDSLLCPGDSTTITITNISAPKFSIKFNNGNFVSDTVFWAKPSATTVYPFEIIDSATLNCGAAPFNVSVAVDVVPAITANVTPGNTVCFGTPVNFTTSAGFTKYTVFANGGASTLTNNTGTFNGVSVNNGDKVAIEGQTAAGCLARSSETIFTVNPLPKPGFTANITNTVVAFDDTTSTATIHSWSFGDGGVSMQKNPSHTYTGVGTFDVKLIAIDANGCVDSVTKQITTENVSVGEIAGLSNLEVYPNPTTSTVNVKLDWQGNGPLKLTVTDITGKTVLQQNILDNGALQHTLNLQNLAGGTYLLRLQADGGEKVIKVLKQDK